jgi:hypothetical protein
MAEISGLYSLGFVHDDKKDVYCAVPGRRPLPRQLVSLSASPDSDRNQLSRRHHGPVHRHADRRAADTDYFGERLIDLTSGLSVLQLVHHFWSGVFLGRGRAGTSPVFRRIFSGLNFLYSSLIKRRHHRTLQIDGRSTTSDSGTCPSCRPHCTMATILLLRCHRLGW